MISLPDKPFPNPSAITEDGADGWTLLVNPDTAGAMAVNRTGALVWRLADGRRTVSDIIESVRRRFPNAPDSLGNDVRVTLYMLCEEGFVGEEIPIRRSH
jgi:hypothetical protein